MDDVTLSENQYYCSSHRVLNSAIVTQGIAWSKWTTGTMQNYDLKEATYTVQVIGINQSSEITEEAATLQVTLESVQEKETEDGLVQLNVIGLEAAYIAEESKEGAYMWLLIFYTGKDETSVGLPQAWITIYSQKETALTGKYSKALNNVDMINGNCFLNTDGTSEGLVMANDVELDINFGGFYTPFVSQGYYYGTYSGSFKLVLSNGKTYFAQFNNMLCNSFTYETLQFNQNEKEYIGMFDEDDSVQRPAEDGLEDILNELGIDLSKPIYNIIGQRVDADYHGVVIQDGHKYIR